MKDATAGPVATYDAAPEPGADAPLPCPPCPVCHAPGTVHFAHEGGRHYLQCPACLATFMHPAHRLDAPGEHAYYQTHQNAVDDPGYRRYLSHLATPLLPRLTPGSHGLDYGCGPGPALASMLGEAGHTMTLYDPLFHNDASVLESCYDFITCSEVAEHFHDPAAEFRHLNALLKPGGLLAVMTSFLADDARFAQWHYRRDPTHVVFYKPATFEHIARQHRWRCEIPVANVVFMHKDG